MKRWILVYITFLLAFNLAAVIYSTSTGGFWNDTSTWVGGVVPTIEDDVVLVGTVYPAINSGSPNHCNNLTIEANGKLTNNTNIRYVHVHGTLINNGEVDRTSSSGKIVIYTYGDIINNGLMQNFDLHLEDLAGINLTNSGTFAPTLLKGTSVNSALYLQSELNIPGSVTVDMSGGKIYLNHSVTRNFSVESGNMQNVEFVGGNGAKFTGNAGTKMVNITANELEIDGVVEMRGTNSFGTLTNWGIIDNVASYSLDINVSDVIYNHGTITRKTNGSSNLNLQRDLYNYGVLNASYVRFMAPGPHQIYQSDTAGEITSPNFIAVAESGDLEMLSNLRFKNTDVNLNNNTLIMNHNGVDYGITLTGGTFSYAVIVGNGENYVKGIPNDSQVNTKMQDFVADNLEIQGVINFLKTNHVTGTLVNNGTMNTQASYTHSLTVGTKLENYGTITQLSNSNTYLYLDGDFYNYGFTDARQINLTASNDHKLYQSGNDYGISNSTFTAVAGNGTIELISNLNFKNSTVNFNNNTLTMNHNGVDYGMSFMGGTLRDVSLSGNGSNYIKGVVDDNENLMKFINFSANNLELQGILQAWGNNNVSGVLVNNSIMSVTASYVNNLTVGTRLENYGSITQLSNSTANLYLERDFYNYGFIDARNIGLRAPGPHQLYQSSSADIIRSPNFTAAANSGNIELLSNLRFQKTNVELNNNTLIMNKNGIDRSIFLTGGSLQNAVITGSGANYINGIFNDNGAPPTLHSLQADNIGFQGEILIRQTNTFTGVFKNHANVGVPQNYSGTINANGALENYGNLTRGNSSLTVNVRDNLYNYGNIDVNYVYVNGTQNQYIRNAGTINWSGKLYLVSDIGSAQWWLDGVMIQSNYTANYNADPAILGTWRPYNVNGYGRQIVIGDGTSLVTPQIVSFNEINGILRLTWYQVPDALAYTIWAAETPDGEYTPYLQFINDYDLTDGVVIQDIMPDVNARFFRITAIN